MELMDVVLQGERIMKIYEICEYGCPYYSPTITKEQKEKLNDMSNDFNYVKEVELNEQNICAFLNKIFISLDDCKSNLYPQF